MTSIPAIQMDVNPGIVCSERPVITGAYSSIANLVLDFLWRKRGPGFNYTFQYESEVGSTVGIESGCYGSLYRNETDFAVGIFDYPIGDPDIINPFQVFTEEPFVILQGYNISQYDPADDVLRNSVEAVHIGVWIIVFYTILIIVSLLIAHSSLSEVVCKSKLLDISFESLCLFISQESRNSIGFLEKFLTILLTLASFWGMQYFCNYMATDMVIVPKPQVIESYQGILDRTNVKPLFIKEISEYKKFESSDVDSVEYK
jgi:hypothetical protein